MTHRDEYYDLSTDIGDHVDGLLRDWYNDLPGELQPTVEPLLKTRIGSQKLRQNTYHILLSTYTGADPYDNTPALHDSLAEKPSYEASQLGIALLNIGHYRLNQAHDEKFDVDSDDAMKNAMTGAHVAYNGAQQAFQGAPESVQRAAHRLNETVLRSFTAELKTGGDMMLTNDEMIVDDDAFHDAYYGTCAGPGVGGFFRGINELAYRTAKAADTVKPSDNAKDVLDDVMWRFGEAVEDWNALADFIATDTAVSAEKTADDQFADLRNKTATIATRTLYKRVKEDGTEDQRRYLNDVLLAPSLIDDDKILHLLYDTGTYQSIRDGLKGTYRDIDSAVSEVSRHGVGKPARKGLHQLVSLIDSNKYEKAHEAQRQRYPSWPTDKGPESRIEVL